MQTRKRITDPVHGSILLTDLEADILASKSFQRLHNVRQLGLAYYVFPAGNYSRLSHSLGACHNASKMLAAIKRNGGETAKKLVSKFEEALRLGALLHDLGHYPFSHATEHEVQNYYRKKLTSSLLCESEAQAENTGSQTALNHEALGAFILKNDPELLAIFERHEKNLDEVVQIFNKSNPENTLVEIISSDLDCDRLDYLRRTSHHTGLPYGSVDTDFLVSQATIDENGRFCYTEKAARAGDHLLVSRYYDYLQVPYHKTVAALEWSLVNCISGLLEANLIDCDISSISTHIQAGTWRDFDDNMFFGKFRELLAQTTHDCPLRDHLRAILERKPAKVLCTKQALYDFTEKRASELMESASSVLASFAKENGIDGDRLKVWPIEVTFAKYQAGSSVNLDADDESTSGAVRVLCEDKKTSHLLCQRQDTLFSRLIGLAHKGFRILYLPHENDTASYIASLEQKISSALA